MAAEQSQWRLRNPVIAEEFVAATEERPAAARTAPPNRRRNDQPLIPMKTLRCTWKCPGMSCWLPGVLSLSRSSRKRRYIAEIEAAYSCSSASAGCLNRVAGSRVTAGKSSCHVAQAEAEMVEFLAEAATGRRISRRIVGARKSCSGRLARSVGDRITRGRQTNRRRAITGNRIRSCGFVVCRNTRGRVVHRRNRR